MSKIQVSEAFLAELARSNSEILNKVPLMEEDYNISFEYGGQTFKFSQANGYWKWSYE